MSPPFPLFGGACTCKLGKADDRALADVFLLRHFGNLSTLTILYGYTGRLPWGNCWDRAVLAVFQTSISHGLLKELEAHRCLTHFHPLVRLQVDSMVSDARFILLVEKDAAFMRLAEDRFYNTYPCVIMTAKGQPDVASRWGP